MPGETYDYGPEDIAHVEARFAVFAEPTAHVDVTYVVHLKNGEDREHSSGRLDALPAAMAAVAVLEAKVALDQQTAEAAPKAESSDRRWRNRGR